MRSAALRFPGKKLNVHKYASPFPGSRAFQITFLNSLLFWLPKNVICGVAPSGPRTAGGRVG